MTERKMAALSHQYGVLEEKIKTLEGILIQHIFYKNQKTTVVYCNNNTRDNDFV